MWTVKEFANVIARNPEGGTFWTRSHRTVRYIRVFHLNKGTIVAIMTEIWRYKRKGNNKKVELFVRTPAGDSVAEFFEAEKTLVFLGKLLSSPILEQIEEGLLQKVQEFIATPDKTHLVTW